MVEPPGRDDSDEPPTRSTLWIVLSLILPALAGSLLYRGTLSYPFVYDDNFVVLNRGIRSLLPLSKFFTDADVQSSNPQLAHDIYRPLTTLSDAVTTAHLISAPLSGGRTRRLAAAARLADIRARRPAADAALLKPRESKISRLLRRRFASHAPPAGNGAARTFRAVRTPAFESIVGVRRAVNHRLQDPLFQFPVKYGKPYLVHAGASAVQVRPLGAAPAGLVNLQGLLAYPDAFPSAHVLFDVGSASVEELLLLEDRSAPKSFRYEITPRGAAKTLALDSGGGLRARDGAGRPLFALSTPLVFDSAGVSKPGRFKLRRTAQEEGSPYILTMSFNDDGLRYPVLIDPTWTTDGNKILQGSRFGHTMTVTAAGVVMIVGGEDSTGLLATTETYDPTDGSATAAAPLVNARSSHTATLLPTGLILVAGGGAGATASTAELYDPDLGVNGQWSATTNNLSAQRRLHTATLLGNGKVLVAGGIGLSSAELYDPAAGTWAATGSMSTTRERHSATLLPDGRVLVTGGYNGALPLGTAELYDPATGTWSAANPMGTARYSHTATNLTNGKVLIAAGTTGAGASSTAELYDPAADTWAATGSLSTARERHYAALLPDGKVLVLAGSNNATPLGSTEVYDADAGAWASAGALAFPRYAAGATMLPNGRVLVAGGVGGGLLNSLELYSPSLGSWSATGAMTTGRREHTITVLPDGRVLVAGGRSGGTFLSTAEIYDPALGTWAATGSMGTPRALHTASLLINGKVLVAGGRSTAGTYEATAELYDPSGGAWSPTGSMATAREGHSATTLVNGQVLAAGGGNASATALSSAEFYNPDDATWSPAPSMLTARRMHGALLIPVDENGEGGEVLVTGGQGVLGLTNTAELYQPDLTAWSTVGALSAARSHHTMSLLNSGDILVAGGLNNAQAPLATAEIYDSGLETFAPTGSLSTARSSHTALTLPDGRILVIGGSGGTTLASSELFEPGAGSWSAGPALGAARSLHGAVVLGSGTVLVAGGAPGPLSTAELASYTEYDFKLSTVAFRRPVINTINGSGSFPVTLVTNAVYTLTGSTFTGLAGGAGGNSAGANAPSNYPRVFVRRKDSNGASRATEGGALGNIADSVFGATEMTNYANGNSSTTLDFEVGPELSCGYYDIFVVADGIISDFRPLKLLPAALTSVPSAAAPPFAAVSSHAVTGRWVDASNEEISGYRTQVSSASDFTGTLTQVDTGNPDATQLSLAGLDGNTTYYFRVAARNCAGVGTFSGSLGSTSTMAALTADEQMAGMTDASVSANWKKLAAAPRDKTSEGYILQASTDPAFGGALISSATANVGLSTLTVSGLAPNTTYYLRAGSLNWAGAANFTTLAGSTATFAKAPLSAISTFTAVASGGFGVLWERNGNPLATSSYTVQVSTANDFNAGASDQVTFTTAPAAGPAATFTSLTANTTYYFRARTLPHNGPPSAYVNLGSTRTLINQPGAAAQAFADVGLSSMSVAWTHNGNPVDVSTYAVVLTTGASYPNSFTGNVALTTNPAGASPMASLGALAVNSTYYLFIEAVNADGIGSGPAAFGSSATFAMPPAASAPTFTQIDIASMSVIWSANANPLNVTQYLLTLSTGAVFPNTFTGNVALSTRPAGAALQATPAGLSQNTTYFLAVEAINHRGVSSGLVTFGSTATLAAEPLSLASTYTAFAPDGFSINWDANSNPLSVTTYTLHLSTSYFFDPGAIDQVFLTTSPDISASATITGLSVNTTYFTRIRAVNHSGTPTLWKKLGSTATATYPPATAVTTFSALSIPGIDVRWDRNGNPVDITSYTVVLTTGASYPNAFSGNVSFATMPAGPSPGASFGGLTENTTYYFFARSLNVLGSATPFVALGSTATLAKQPLFNPPAFSAVSGSGLSLSWLSDGNPLVISSYTVQVSTAFDFNPGAADQVTLTTAPAAGPSATLTGLSANTTYYAQVRAVNHNGIPTAFTNLASTITLSNMPTTAVTTFTAVNSSSISVRWEANGNPPDVTTYTVVLTTGVGFPNTYTGNISLSTAPAGAAPAATLLGLETYTTYYLFAEAVNSGGVGSGYVALGSTRTRLGPPVAAPATFTAVNQSSATVAWQHNGNPVDVTTYTVVLSTGVSFPNTFTGNVTLTTNPVGAAPTATLSGLTANTTYALFIEAVDETGAGGGFVAFGSTASLAATPATAATTFTAVHVSSAGVAWTGNGNPVDVTSYTVVLTTGVSYPNTFTGNLTLTTAPAATTLNAEPAGLEPNTTYYLLIAAVNHNGLSSAFTALGSTITLAADPASAVSTFSAVALSSFTALWDAAGNPLVVSSYTVQVATSPDFTGTDQVTFATAPAAGPAASFTGLGINTTYYFRARAINHGGIPTAYSLLGSTSTLADEPASPVLTNVQFSSLSLSWSNNGDPPGTLYAAEVSTDNFVTLSASSRTLNTSATFFALSANATFYIQVRAENHNGLPTQYIAAASTSTMAAAPLSAPLSAVTYSSITANWGANGNIPGTRYFVDISTDGFSTLNDSSATFNTSAPFAGLTNGTTYYFRARALGNNGNYSSTTVLPSTVTLLLPPGPASPVFTTVDADSVTVNWTDGGNGPGPQYIAQISTDAFSTINIASTTNNLSALFGAGGEGPALTSNSTQYFRVAVIGGGGPGAFVDLGSTSTLAGIPLSAASTFTAVAADGLMALWTPNTNPLIISSYTVQVSTAMDFNAGATDQVSFATAPAAGPAASFTGLSVNTTYYFRARAVNHNGLFTSYADLGSTATLTNPPVTALSTFTAVGLASMSMRWEANGNLVDVTTYTVVLTTGASYPNAFSGNIPLSTYPAGASPAATLAGLAANTTYYLFVDAVNRNGVGSGFIALGGTATLAAAPVTSASTFTSVAITSVSVAWNVDINPVDVTSYTVVLSTGSSYPNNFAGNIKLSTSPAGATPDASLTGLAVNTTYYLFAEAVNHNAIGSGFTALGSTATLVKEPLSAPTTFSAVAVTSFSVAWNAAGNPLTFSSYTVQVSTASDFTGTDQVAFTTAPAAGPNAAFTSLSVNTTYYFRVRAQNHNGIATGYVNLGSTATLANTPAAPALTGIHVTSATFTWGAAGNPADTLYAAQVSTDAFATVNQTSGTLALSATFFALTPNSTHYLRARAFSRAGAPTGYAVLGATLSFAAAPVSAPTSDVSDSSVSANWAANGNPAGTVYEARLSTDTFATLNASSVTTSTVAVFSGLDPNTTYYLQVRAVGINGRVSAYTALPSTITNAYFPGVPAQPFTTVDEGSVTVNWTDGGNPPGTIYTAKLSTDAFATVNLASQTSNLSVLLGAGGEGPELERNTTYYFQVSAFGPSGQGPFIDLGSTSTLAAAPLSAASTFSAVAGDSFSAAWSPNGNPLIVSSYTVQVSTAMDFNAGATDQVSFTTAPAGGAAAAFTGLSINTTYYFRARATNHNGVPTPYVSLGSTSTLANQPATVASTYTAVAVTSMSVAWSANGNPADSTPYTAVLSTGAAYPNTFTGNVALASTPAGAAPASTFAGLAANTTYYFFVEALNHNAMGSGFIALGSTSTAAAAPLATASTFTAVAITSASVAWNVGINPVDVTSYTVVLTTGASYPNALPGNITLSTAPAGATPGASLTGLAVNTTYYLFVEAVNHNGVGSGFTALGSTSTLVKEPLSAATTFSAVAITSFTAAWDAAGNPLIVSSYTVVVSTASDFNPGASDQVGFTTAPAAGPNAAFTSLSVNTTYYFRVRAQNHNGIATGYVNLGSTATLANEPASPALTGTLALSATFFALTPNATHYLRVRAFNRDGIGTAYAVLSATLTFAAAPVSLPLTEVTNSSTTLDWTGNGNAAGTIYEARLSTDTFATLNASSVTADTAAAFQSLLPNTTYYFQVRALGINGTPSAFTSLPSTITAALPPGQADPVFATVDKGSVTFNWTDGGNGAGTRYTTQLSTNGFTTVNLTSDTLNLSVLFGAGGEGQTLTANTTYSFRVLTNGAGGPGPFQWFGSTATPANDPAGTQILSVTSSTVVLDWLPNANPEPGTDYELWRATDSLFSTPAKSVVATSARTAANLAAATTFYFKIRTKGHNSVYTAFGAVVSTATLPPAPYRTAAPSATVMGISSITWSWAASTFAASYELYAASNTGSLIGATAATSLLHIGLATNTAYGAGVWGLNVSGPAPLSPTTTVYTLALAPTGAAAGTVEATSATLSWSLNTNPAQTTAEVERSTDNITFSTVAAGAITAFTDYDLLGCTTYYYRVRNLNGDGIATGYNTAAAFETNGSTPLPAGAFTAESRAGNLIALSWTPSPSAGITAYRIYGDGGDGSIDYNTPLSEEGPAAVSSTTAVLASSDAYKFGLRAVNSCGVEDPNTTVVVAAPSVGVLPSLRTAVTIPASGKKIKGDRITVVAGLSVGAITQVKEVLFQYRASSDTANWTDIPPASSHPNPDASFPYFVHWDVDAITATNYDVRAMATDISNSSDTVAPAVTLTVVSDNNFDIEEKDVAGDIVKTQVLNNGADNTIQAADKGTGQLMSVLIPAGALNTSTVAVTVTNNPTGTPAGPSAMTSPGISVKISLAGQTDLQGGKKATLTFVYPDADGDGFVDGTRIRVGKLTMFTCPDACTNWTQESASTVDAGNRTVTGRTSHFSFFALFAQPTQTSLSSIRVYPVPFVPDNASSDDGVPYNAGDPNSGIIFDQLPEGVTIKIYTVTGQLVTQFSTGITDRVQWDTRNDSGRDAASGGYIAVISDSGNKPSIRKLLIIR